MADKTTMAAYNKTGYAAASGVSGLNGQLDNFKTDDAALRQQAEAQYADTYAKEQQSYQDQIAALIKSQTDDSLLLNKHYEKSVSSMMSEIQRRGLAVGGLPGTQTDALQKFHNEVMDQRQAIYGTQRSLVEANQQVHANSYEANITQRMADNRNFNLEKTNTLLTTMAELQSKSYQAYIDYLLAKKRRSSGSSRRYSSSGSSSAVGNNTSSAGTSLGANYFSGNNIIKKISATAKQMHIKYGSASRIEPKFKSANVLK